MTITITEQVTNVAITITEDVTNIELQPVVKTLVYRRDTAANFASDNPTLVAGEYAYETDTRKSKIGDGVTAWNDLDYLYSDATSALPPVENLYSNITELLSQQGNQTQGFLQRVADASADPDITSGIAYYLKLGTSTGALSDYDRLTDDEATALENAQGKETSDIGSVIPLDTVFGHWCNMQSANSNTSYTLNNENVISAYAVVLINAASEPSITGADQQGGIPFAANTNLLLVVVNQGDSGVKYQYQSLSVATTPTLQKVTDSGATTTTKSIFQGNAQVGDTSEGELDFGTNGSQISVDGGEMLLRHEDNSYTVDKGGMSFEIVSEAGNWNASTNSPTLANTDTGVKSVEYKVSVAGSQDFGAGSITFAVGDIVANDGSIWYKKVDNNQSGGSVSLPWISITDAPYNAVADSLGNSGVDSTAAFNDALDALVTAGGGVLYIPHTDTTRFNITMETTTVKDYSNIVIMSFGTGRIFVKDTTPLSNPSRGNLIKIGDGTDNFTIKNLDILTSSGCDSNNFENGVICQDALAGFTNVTIENLKIYSESRPDTQRGNHGITFFRDLTNASDTATCSNVTIRDCDIYLTGNSIYGFHTLRDIENIYINNNVIELTAHTDNSNDAFNAIALYGDSRNFSINNNVIKSSGHGAIAASMAENGMIAFNKVYDCNINNEAGIEVEYKESHGTNLTSPDFQPKSVKVIGNYVENCYYGIAVLTRDLTTSSSTETDLFDVLIQGNTCYNNTVNDIIVAANISGTPDYTQRISGVNIDNNYVSSSATDGNIHIYDSDGIKITNNTVIGGAKNIYIGRNANINTIGHLVISGNTLKDATSISAMFFESIGANSYIDIHSNQIDGNSNTVRGIQATANIGSQTIFNIHHNTLIDCTDGIRMTGEEGDKEGSTWAYNKAFNCSVRGFHVAATNGIATYNFSKNCTTADSYGGVGMTATGNKDL